MERKYPVRDRGLPRKCYDYPVESIRKWIAEGKTQAWIGEQLGVNPKLIYKVCKKHDIKCHRRGPRSGPECQMWKGGRNIDKDGYVSVYCPDHPYAKKPNKKYVLEHRLVMELHLGRYLKRHEVVHHKNGDKSDNRLENLELFHSNASHLRKELKGRCPKWTEAGKEKIRLAVVKSVASRKAKVLNDSLSKQ